MGEIARCLKGKMDLQRLGTERKRQIFAWAGTPGQAMEIRAWLPQGNWNVVPISQSGSAFCRMLRPAKPDGIVFHQADLPPSELQTLQTLEQECPWLQKFIILSRQEKMGALKSSGLPACLLPKEGTPGQLKELMERAFLVNQWLLLPNIFRDLPRLQSIPTLPAAHQRAVQILRDPEGSLEEVVDLISSDVGFTAQLLKLANSALFGLSAPASTILDAIRVVGTGRLEALITSAWAFRQLKEEKCRGFHPQEEWKHAVGVAEQARKLARDSGANFELAELAYTAGLLHDIGKIILAGNVSERYVEILKEAAKSRLALWEIEENVLGYNHAALGGALLGLWGLPSPLLRSVAFHHQPDQAHGDVFSAHRLVNQADAQIRDFPH